ncbi:FliH/SctL family protein [Patulibacter sp. SYSU D01012]|uniref:FliH/SctL family protein n=1 Tax=Patulibacter sp. SYSU D01012 TaxID=2817381 RepID=UPI001B30A45B|nr:FliH/SctL family protein [Patulibacter sp. SYSU D01012]
MNAPLATDLASAFEEAAYVPAASSLAPLQLAPEPRPVAPVAEPLEPAAAAVPPAASAAPDRDDARPRPAEFAFPVLERPAAPPTVRELADELAAARDEAERIREEARAEGFAAGQAQGRAEALEQLAPAAATLADALGGARRDALRAADALEREAVELAILLAEKVVAATVLHEPERVLDVVRGALRGVVDRGRVSVHVHPDDVALVRGAMGELLDELGGVERCDVVAERRVTRGGAIVRTTDGELDVRLEAKLERAAQLLRESEA